MGIPQGITNSRRGNHWRNGYSAGYYQLKTRNPLEEWVFRRVLPTQDEESTGGMGIPQGTMILNVNLV
jgi:hypothetical protein